MCRRLHNREAALSRREDGLKLERERFEEAQRLHQAEHDKRKCDLDAHHQTQLAELSTKTAKLVSNCFAWCEPLKVICACVSSYAYSKNAHVINKV